MLIKVFRENQAFTVFFLLLISVIQWSLNTFDSSYEPGIYSLYHYGAFFLFPGLNNIHQYIGLSSALNLLIILFTGTYLSRLVVRYQLITTRTLIPLLVFFFLCLPWLYDYSGFSYTLLTLPVLIFITDNLFKSTEKRSLAFSYFNNAMLLSLASYFNHYLLYFAVFLGFLFFKLRGSQWRELVFIPIGITIPHFILIAFMYLFNVDIKAFIESYKVLFFFEYTMPVSVSLILTGSFAVLLFLVASWKALNQYIKMKILTRKYSISFLILFFLTLLFIVFFPYLNRDSLFFLAAPLSILFGFYFVSCRPNLVNQILFFLFMLGNVAVYVQGYFGL